MFFPDLWEPIWAMAIRRIRRDNPAGAIRLVSLYTRMRPGDPKGWIQLAVLKEDFEAATVDDKIKLLEGAREPTRFHADIEQVLATTYLRRFRENRDRADLATARMMFEKQVTLTPDEPSTYLGLARVAMEEGLWAESISYVHKTREHLSPMNDDKPTDYYTFWSAVWLLLSISDGAAQAEKWLREMAEKHESWAEPDLVLALILEQRDPDAATFHWHRGQNRCEDPSEAEELMAERRYELKEALALASSRRE